MEWHLDLQLLVFSFKRDMGLSLLLIHKQGSHEIVSNNLI